MGWDVVSVLVAITNQSSRGCWATAVGVAPYGESHRHAPDEAKYLLTIQYRSTFTSMKLVRISTLSDPPLTRPELIHSPTPDPPTRLFTGQRL